LQGKDVQSFVNVYAIQFNGNPHSPKVRIKNDIQPGQLGKGFERDAAVLTRHVDVDRASDRGFKLRLDARIGPGILPELLVLDLRWG
jgi:hypothetical protein